MGKKIKEVAKEMGEQFLEEMVVIDGRGCGARRRAGHTRLVAGR